MELSRIACWFTISIDIEHYKGNSTHFCRIVHNSSLGTQFPQILKTINKHVNLYLGKIAVDVLNIKKCAGQSQNFQKCSIRGSLEFYFFKNSLVDENLRLFII